jgi:hypothetical protein
MITHFQCDLCCFRNIHKRNPTECHADELSLCCLRRANLDSLWSRERSTVSNNARLVRKSAEYNIATNQEETFPVMGPMPVDDVTGHAVAVHVLLASRETGRYHADHKQYETIRKHRSVFSNLWNASARGAAVNISIGKDTRGQSLLLTACPTDSEWYKRFDKGLRKRMGQDVRSQLGFSIGVMTVMMRRLELLWNESPPGDEKDDVLGAMVYSVISYCNALRGNEGFKMDLGGMRKHMQRGLPPSATPHCVAPLLGRFKGEDGERYHLLLMASVTASGLEPRRMLQLLMERREEQGFLHGPAFVDNQGVEVSSGRYEALILGSLLDHQQWEREQQVDIEKLFDGVEIEEVYGISRSFKRGAITRAQEAGVRQPEVEFMGRWRTVEQAAGRKPGRSVREHYTELVQMLDARLRFSKAL